MNGIEQTRNWTLWSLRAQKKAGTGYGPRREGQWNTFGSTIRKRRTGFWRRMITHMWLWKIWDIFWSTRIRMTRTTMAAGWSGTYSKGFILGAQVFPWFSTAICSNILMIAQLACRLRSEQRIPSKIYGCLFWSNKVQEKTSWRWRWRNW